MYSICCNVALLRGRPYAAAGAEPRGSEPPTITITVLLLLYYCYYYYYSTIITTTLLLLLTPTRARDNQFRQT